MAIVDDFKIKYYLLDENMNKKLIKTINLPIPEEPYPKVTCIRCTYKWIPIIKHPKKCPRCKSPYWDKEYVKGRKKQSQFRD